MADFKGKAMTAANKGGRQYLPQMPNPSHWSGAERLGGKVTTRA